MGIEGKVAVVGAAGLVGSEVCAYLRRNEVDVSGVSRFRFPGAQVDLEELGVDCVSFDALWDDAIELPDARTLILQIDDPGLHHAMPEDETARKAVWKLHFEAVGKVALRYTIGRKRRPKPPAFVIHGSTPAVYGRHPEPRSEQDACVPVTEYGRVRMAQEHLLNFLAAQAETRCVNLRYYYANSLEGGILLDMAEKILCGESLGNQPDMRLQVIGLEDVARYTVLAAEKADRLPEAINVCHPTIWTMRTLAQRLRDVLGEGEVRFSSESGGREQSLIGNPAKLIDLFNEPRQELTPLMEGICSQAKHDLAADSEPM